MSVLSRVSANGLTSTVILGCASLCVAPVYAVGLMITPPSKMTGIANAGQAVYKGSTTVAITNPAAMSLNKEKFMGGSLTVLFSDMEFNEGWDCSADDSCAESNIGHITAIPTGGIIKPMDNNFTWGFGIGAVSGSGLDYGEEWLGRTLITENEVQVLGITNALSYQVNDGFSIGASLTIMYGEVMQEMDMPPLYDLEPGTLEDMFELGIDLRLCDSLFDSPAGKLSCASNVFNNSGLSADDITNGLAQVNDLAGYINGGQGTPVELEGDDIAAAAVIGFVYQFNDEHRIGMSYSHLTDFTFEGDATIRGPLLSNVDYQKQHMTMSWDMPDKFIVSGAHMLTSKLELFWDYEHVFYDVFDSNDIRIDGYPVISVDRNFKNASRYALGAEYQLNDAWKLQLGASMDESPVDDEDRNPDIPVSEIYKISIGGIHQLTQDLEVSGFFLYEFLGDGDIERLASLNGHEIGDSITGDYDSQIFVLGGSFNYRF
jgi:long-chain fatty acid transport protein